MDIRRSDSGFIVGMPEDRDRTLVLRTYLLAAAPARDLLHRSQNECLLREEIYGKRLGAHGATEAGRN